MILEFLSRLCSLCKTEGKLHQGLWKVCLYDQDVTYLFGLKVSPVCWWPKCTEICHAVHHQCTCSCSVQGSTWDISQLVRLEGFLCSDTEMSSMPGGCAASLQCHPLILSVSARMTVFWAEVALIFLWKNLWAVFRQHFAFSVLPYSCCQP